MTQITMMVWSHLETDILECEVKWALGGITTNKASGGDGIPVELFQIVKDDAMKVLHSICQQIWKTQRWPQDWNRSAFILIPKKGDAKECSNHRTPNTTTTYWGLSGVLDFRKGRRTRDQIANIRWIIGKARKFQKKHLLLLHWLH